VEDNGQLKHQSEITPKGTKAWDRGVPHPSGLPLGSGKWTAGRSGGEEILSPHGLPCGARVAESSLAGRYLYPDRGWTPAPALTARVSARSELVRNSAHQRGVAQ